MGETSSARYAYLSVLAERVPEKVLPTGKKLPSKPKRVAVGIDASATSTGIVTLDVVTGEVVDARALQPKDISARRLSLVHGLTWDWLCGIANCRVEHICLEDFVRGAFSNQALIGQVTGIIKYTLMKWFDDAVAYPTLVAGSSHKKFVCGKGTGMKKEDVKLWTFKRWGFEHQSNDVVDAYGLAQIARAIVNPDIELIKPQLEVIAGLKLKLHTEAPPELRYQAA